MSLFGWLRRKAETKHPASPEAKDAASPMELLAEEVAGILRARSEIAGVTYLPQDNALRVERRGAAPGAKQYVYLRNLLAETREMSPDARTARINFFLEGLVNPFDDADWGTVEPLLRSTIRPCTTGFLYAPSGELGLQTLARPFAPFLDERIVIDLPKGMSYVTLTRLKKWGVSVDDVFSAASSNASQFAPIRMEVYSDTNGPVLHLVGDEDYPSSRLLIPGWLASLRERVEGTPLVAIPERSMLFVTGDDRPEAVRWLAEMAQREWQSAQRSISPALYTLDDDGHVVPYKRPGSDEIALLVRRGHELLLGREYAEQKATLDEHFKRTNTDVFVASASLAEDHRGRVVSYSMWTDGVETLLPYTDAIVAGGQPGNGKEKWMAIVPFDAARAIAGHSWSAAEVPGGPPRLRASGLMSEALKKALQGAQVSLDDIP